MIKCPECGSTDVYFLYGFEVWQKKDGGFELDEEHVQYVLEARDNYDERFICNECGNEFRPCKYLKKMYKLHVSKIEYGSVMVEADSEKEAMEKFNETEVEWHDSEISDVTAELLDANVQETKEFLAEKFGL